MSVEASIVIDLEQLDKQIKEQRAQDELVYNNTLSMRTSTFTLGLDPQISSEQVSAPELTSVDILRDGLSNPFLQVNWQIKRELLDSSKIVLFKVFRRRLVSSSAGALRVTNDLSYSRNGIDKIAKKSKKTGKFSVEKKAIVNVARSAIPLSTLNQSLNLFQSNASGKIYQNSLPDAQNYSPSFAPATTQVDFYVIASVTPSSFLSNTEKFVISKDRNIQDFYFRDKSVGFQQSYEYYIEAVGKELGSNTKSNSVLATLEDFTPISAPEVAVKQSKESEANIIINARPEDNVSRVLIYRKSEDQINFNYILDLPMIKDSVVCTDTDISYTKKYTYRIFSENIHGVLSDPSEFEFFSSVQKITPESRSNNLKIPIMSALQDQNSDFIRISIFPNDPMIAYYDIERKDMTIKEKSFLVPAKTTNSYGGVGWGDNKFFVEKVREELQNTETSYTSKMFFKEIQFIDETVQFDHIYQYRVRGYDLFGNPSSYNFGLVKVVGKKALRNPINVRSQIIRSYPYRVKILWEDDNFVINQENGTKNNFRVQRRKISENIYETFPLVSQNFIIDEAPTSDAVSFDGKDVSNSQLNSLDNLNISERELAQASQIRRSFNMPNFLEENETYYYRIIAISPTGDQSNATQEFKLLTVPDLSEPLTVVTEILNTKVRPVVARLTWKNDISKSIPDYWVIERKVDNQNEIFKAIGKSYLQNQFIDYDIKAGYTYIYRIKSLDTLGRVSEYAEARLAL
jgi:hypothetical protein